MDDWLGDVLGAMDARGLLDDTLVVVTSDHGENFGESGLMAHAFSLDERLTHVPLVAAGPGAESLAGLIEPRGPAARDRAGGRRGASLGSRPLRRRGGRGVRPADRPRRRARAVASPATGAWASAAWAC